MKIFCIIPAWNEEKNIEKTVTEAKEFVDAVVVVDDGSQDRTGELAKKAGAVVLRHIVNRFQGASLQTGNRYAILAGADIIVHFDADGQHLAGEIAEMIEPIKKGEADIVFGSRFLEKESRIPWAKKNIIFPIARIVNRLVAKADLSDPQSGFRAMNRKALEKIRIENDGMAHASEILAKAFKSDLKIKEIPITVIYHHFGQKFSGGVKILKDLFLSSLIR